MKDAQTDMAVARIMGYPKDGVGVMIMDGNCVLYHRDPTPCKCWTKPFSPTSDWKLAGPIIEREGIGTMPTGDAAAWVARGWDEVRMDFISEYGPTPLVAAMRLYVKTKIGSDIDIPPDILKGD